MKRAIRFALFAVLCWLAPAQAYITWGPRGYVPTPAQAATPDEWTSANNTWSVSGDQYHVRVAYMAPNAQGRECGDTSRNSGRPRVSSFGRPSGDAVLYRV